MDAPDLEAILGAQALEPNAKRARGGDRPGPWTPVGGDLLFIEAAQTPGNNA